LFARVKSLAFVPPSTTEVICSEPVPELVSVTVWGGTLVPCVTAPKERVLGESLATGVPGGGVAPVPVSCIDCGELGASSLMVMSAVRWPEPSGENVTEIVQAEPIG